jgi:hypothetical protein
MAYVTENDYKKMAEAIADDLVNNGISLNDSVSKLASSMDMNHEQIRRLCETTNNVTFNKMFQSKDKTASDRMIEFDVADADKVLGSLIKRASWITVESQDVVSLSEYRSLREDVAPIPLEKTASTFELRPEARANKEVDQRTLRKTLDHLRHEKIATELLHTDAVSELRSQFRRLYRDMSFETFEKNAVALYGEKAAPVLNTLRSHMRLPEVTYNCALLQKTAGYVDDSAIEFKLLAEALSSAEKLRNINAGIAKLETLV